MTRATSIKKDDLRERIEQAIKDHPPMPTLYRDLLPFVKDPEADYDKLSKIIRNDPGVTMNVLRVANSSYFSGKDRIDSLRQAFVRLGSRRLFQIIISQGAATRLVHKLDGYDLAPRMLLTHAVGVAVTAENLAHRLNIEAREVLFTAGLLHDMGKVVLDPFMQETRPQFDRLLAETNQPFDELETEILGITHAEAGARLMALWSFPADVVEMVGCHHRPEKAQDFANETLMIHFADTLIYSQGLGDGIDGFRYTVADDTAAKLGLRARDVEQVASSTLDQLRELEQMM